MKNLTKEQEKNLIYIIYKKYDYMECFSNDWLAKNKDITIKEICNMVGRNDMLEKTIIVLKDNQEISVNIKGRFGKINRLKAMNGEIYHKYYKGKKYKAYIINNIYEDENNIYII